MRHSDRGRQYASRSYRELLAKRGIECSLGRAGNCWDNEVMESLFRTFKQEWANLHRSNGLEDSRAATHDDIEVFYNRQRQRSALGYKTPAEADGTAG